MDISSLTLNFDIELDSVNKKIILLVTEGFSSSYAIWVAMKKESEAKHDSSKTLVYKNIYERTISLLNDGYLQELKVEGKNIHGRREYKVTIKGLKQLLLYYINHPKSIENIDKYMDKVKMDKNPFTAWLRDITGSMVWIVNIHNKFIVDHIEIPHEEGKFTSIKHTFKPKKSLE